MKKLVAISLMGLSLSSFSVELKIKDFNYYKLTDVQEKGLSPKYLYDRMDTTNYNINSAICSNIALLWGYDFKKFFNLNTGKIFLFYTHRMGPASNSKWWYHVAPLINEGGKVVIMDAGFPYMIDTPVTMDEWFLKFAGSTKCKAIQATDTDLIERMNRGKIYPEYTSYGQYDCYYKIAPDYVWTPAVMAEILLGRDMNGRPVQPRYEEFNSNELATACLEATTRPWGRFFGAGREVCQKKLGFSIDQ